MYPGRLSRTLGISRAAVWKAIGGPAPGGYTIQSAPNRGYRLDKRAPDRVRRELTGPLAGCHAGEKLLCLDTVDSTNTSATPGHGRSAGWVGGHQ